MSDEELQEEGDEFENHTYAWDALKMKWVEIKDNEDPEKQLPDI